MKPNIRTIHGRCHACSYKKDENMVCGLVGVTDSWCSGLVFACGESQYKAGDGVFKAVRYLPLRYGFWWPAAVLVNEPFL